MKTATATEGARKFAEFLSLVEGGQSVQFLRHGKPVARLVPDAGWMTGAEVAGVFAGYKADALDRASADAIAAEIRKLDEEQDNALAH